MRFELRRPVSRSAGLSMVLKSLNPEHEATSCICSYTGCAVGCRGVPSVCGYRSSIILGPLSRSLVLIPRNGVRNLRIRIRTRIRPLLPRSIAFRGRRLPLLTWQCMTQRLGWKRRRAQTDLRAWPLGTTGPDFFGGPHSVLTRRLVETFGHGKHSFCFSRTSGPPEQSAVFRRGVSSRLLFRTSCFAERVWGP